MAESTKQDRLNDCLERLAEVEGLLAGIRHAEDALAGARRTLADLCAEAHPSPQLGLHPTTATSTENADTAEQQTGTQEPGPCCIRDQVILQAMEETESLAIACAASVTPRSSARAQRAREQRRGWVLQKLGNVWVPILLPDSLWVIVWDLCCLVFIIFETYLLPFDLAFNVQQTGAAFLFISFIDAYFIIDIPLNFIKAFKTDAGVIITQPRQIANKYVTWLVPDVLAGIPWEWIPLGGHAGKLAQFTKMLRLLRVARLLRLVRMDFLPEQATAFIEASRSLNFMKGISRLLFILFGITHWAGCIWFYIGNNSQEADTWISANMLQGANAADAYAYSIYFTLTTMTTVGYGDITPQNGTEVIFVTVLLLIATVVFAAVMGSITDLILSAQGETTTLDTRVRMLSEYMNWRSMPKEIHDAVRKHMRYQWEAQQGYDAYENELKENLPPTLRKEVCYHVYGQILRTLPFLAWMQDFEVCLKELSQKVTSIILSPGDRLFRRGEPHTTIFVLRKGSVKLSLNEHLFSTPLDTNDPDSEEDEIKESTTLIETLSPFAMPGRTSMVDVMLLSNDRHHRSKKRAAAADLFHMEVMEDAMGKMHRIDLRENWAARVIQRAWQQRKHNLKHARRRAYKSRDTCIRSKTVQAPAYFGESCLWVPIDEWDAAQQPVHRYSVHCQTPSEVVILFRSEIFSVIRCFSPWLQDRFEVFRRSVLVGLENQDPMESTENGRPSGSTDAATGSADCDPFLARVQSSSLNLPVKSRTHLSAPEQQGHRHVWASLREPLMHRSSTAHQGGH